MAQTKEISEDLRKRVAVAHQAGKGYKAISKEFGLHKSAVRQVVYKWRKFKTTVTLPRSPKQLKAFLTLANVNVHESAARRTLNNNGVHGRVGKRKQLLSKMNISANLQFAKDHVDKPDDYWRNV
ncbi:hypothetical protein M9458_029801, partial [Cirrhinus mrigala]